MKKREREKNEEKKKEKGAGRYIKQDRGGRDIHS